MLVHKKEGKEQDTPASAFSLRYSVCRAAIKNSPLRSSNSCLPTTPAKPALLGAADGDPEHHATATISELKKKESGF